MQIKQKSECFVEWVQIWVLIRIRIELNQTEPFRHKIVFTTQCFIHKPQRLHFVRTGLTCLFLILDRIYIRSCFI